MTGTQEKGRMPHSRIEFLRKKINNEVYLNEAIQRIAQVLSNDILDIPQGGLVHGRQWKKWKQL
ncbi:MAG: hypothetical protein LBB98_05255 [Treponema sp.]|jgi:hypothetical protein|nr:hypothetical protein [Treponema sp.]